jgi:hypothetical protein
MAINLFGFLMSDEEIAACNENDEVVTTTQPQHASTYVRTVINPDPRLFGYGDPDDEGIVDGSLGEQIFGDIGRFLPDAA